HEGEVYVVNVDNPTGTPGSSPDYTQFSMMGATGATGATGAFDTGTALFTVSGGPTGALVPVSVGDELVFTTNTPEVLTLSTATGSAVINIDGIDSSAIIPYASAGIVVLNILAGGLAGTSAYIGFGYSGVSLTTFGIPIDFSKATGASNFAFTMPRSGTLTDLSANFTTTVGVSLGVGETHVQAQVYVAPAGSNVFIPDPSSLLTLSPGVVTVTAGQLLSGSKSGLGISVNQGDQVLLVFGATSNGGVSVPVGLIEGYANAGLSISS
ncbi:MAG: hypothetical protein FWG67_07425, partial [Defluviitaleaceae bacterium]|nr:hypothetical protein [Defluviitaleaceae bacterium]